MTRIALGIEYDGHGFYGWQRQTSLPSIQATLEQALSQIAAEPITTVCAGRTDAGVHAIGQVVHFDTHQVRDPRAWTFGTNRFLPSAIRVLWAQDVPQNFNARRSATSRRYRYVIYNHPLRPGLLKNYVAWYYRKLNVQKMLEATQYWLGEHDFSSFRAAECQSHSPIRLVKSIDLARVGDQIIIDITANAFLHHMVRNMVGVLMKIGSSDQSPSWAKQVLEAKNRQFAGITAVPSGLYLAEVQYPQSFNLPVSKTGSWFFHPAEGSIIV